MALSTYIYQEQQEHTYKQRIQYSVVVFFGVLTMTYLTNNMNKNTNVHFSENILTEPF
jgi:hypothetical protein